MANNEDMGNLVSVFKGDVSRSKMENWLNQFKAEHRPIIKTLVQNFRYYTYQDIFDLLRQLYEKLTNELEIDCQTTWFIPTGIVAKSGDAIAYFFRRNNGIPEESFIRINDLSEIRVADRPTVVFLDDFIGSGQEALYVATESAEPIKSLFPDSRFVFAAIVGFSEGISRLQEANIVEVCVVEEHDSSTKPFSPDTKIFTNPIDRENAEVVVREYCSALKPKTPLGYGSSQGLIGFFFGTPNNTLPIFWSSKNQWEPLLPHGESIRDPKRLLGIPIGGRTRLPRIWDQDSSDLEELVSQEATELLVKGFQTLQNMRRAAQIFANVGFSDLALRDLLECISQLKEGKHEGKDICTALFVPNRDFLENMDSKLFLKSIPPFSLSENDQLKTLCTIIDGYEGAALVDPDGIVHGLLKYDQLRTPPDIFIPPCYHSVAGMSLLAEGFVVLIPKNQRVIIFDRGARSLSWRYSKWHVHAIPKSAADIEAEHGLQSGLIARALRLCFILADAGYGALITLGDHKGVSAHSGKTAPTSYRWSAVSLFEEDDIPVLSFAKQDGAVVVDSHGDVKNIMTMLQPPADAQGDEETGRGARHNAASKITEVTGTLALAVSEDGPITLYSKGRRLFRLMG